MIQQAILTAKHCVLSADTDGILHSLNEIADNLKLLKSTLARMHGKASETRSTLQKNQTAYSPHSARTAPPKIHCLL